MRAVLGSAAWVAGVLLAMERDLPLAVIVSFLVAAAALLGVALLRRWRLLLPVAVLLLLLGAWRGELAGASPPSALEEFVGREVKLEGLVTDDPERRGTLVRFRLRADRIDTGDGWRPAEEDVLVAVQPPSTLVGQREASYVRYGDRLELNGKIERPPTLKGFDYREYLARQGVGWVAERPEIVLIQEREGSPVLSFIYRVRLALAGSLERVLPEPQASLGQMILLGARGGVPEEVLQAFRDTGTTHLLAISGLNMAIVLGLTLPLSQTLLGRRRNLYLLVPLLALWMYALLSGLAPSVERAAIMASLYLVALALGRPGSPLPALAVAAAVMVGRQPTLLYDLSFQLSFMAVAGILLLVAPRQRVITRLLGPLLRRAGWAQGPTTAIGVAVAVTLAATAATFPLLLFNFGRIAVYSVPATLLALPAFPFALAASLFAALAGLLALPLGQVVGWLAWLPLTYTTEAVETMARLPGRGYPVEPFGGVLVWLSYAAAGLLILSLRRGWLRRRLAAASLGPIIRRAATWVPSARVQAIVLFSLAAGVALVWSANAALPDGNLHVSVLDVGQGDAILLRGPGGQQVLVDGGPDPRRLLQALGERMPFWDRTIDLLVLSHPHEDHLAGLVEVVRRYRVRAVLDTPPDPGGSPLWEEWQAVLKAKGVRVITASEGQRIVLGDQVVLEVLNPPDPLLGGSGSDVDNNGTVVRAQHGLVSLLLTGDLEMEGELSLLDRGADVRSTVLKVAHHGSRDSSREEFLARVRPQLALISVGKENRYGHPHQEALDRLKDVVGLERVLTTAEGGDIELVSDGRRLEVRTER
ncbi:MAG: DNA internalization-related competence protein ComEC/Rec2 [Chloroflexi bacterium]|nr:DNA internalization-related competence protein ComEC/Rec2 [Chloroflexota bacterium]